MFRKHFRAVVLLCLAIAAPAVRAQTVALLPGGTSSSGQIGLYSGGALGGGSTLAAASGSYRILAKPDASKYYILSKSYGTPVAAVDASGYRQIGSRLITAPATAGAIAPDGSRLIICVFGNVYVINTSTDQPVQEPRSGSNFIYLSAAGNASDAAISQDSRTAYVASSIGTGGFLTAIDLPSMTWKTVPLPGIPSGVAVGPNGLVYVSMPNRVRELNPATLQLTNGGEMLLTGSPGELVFAPDGQYAVALNGTPVTGVSLWVLNLPVHGLAGSVPSSGNPVLDNVYVAGTERWFVTSSQANTLYDLTLVNGAPQLGPSQLSSVLPATSVGSVAVSGEFPPRYLYAVTNTSGGRSLVRVDLQTNTIVDQVPVGSEPYVIQYFAAAPTTGAISLTGYNTSQGLTAGQVSLPLVARVTDAQGRGVQGVSVGYAVTSGLGLSLSAASATTNAGGYASITATAQSTSGAVGTITATTPAGSVSYSLTLGGSGGGTGGGGTGGSSPLIRVVSGNGQVVPVYASSGKPLVIQLRDQSGNPVANAPVAFAITQGQGTIGGIGNAVISTDANGMSTPVYFIATGLNPSLSYSQAIVTATANGSTANFVITTVPLQDPNNQTINPAIAYLTKPVPGSTLTGPAGTTLSGAIQIQVVAGTGPQQGHGIPNVSLNLSFGGANAPDLGHCAGGIPLTNDQGFATCDLILGPASGSGLLVVDIGGYRKFAPLNVQVTAGASPTQLRIASGNNQSGQPGQAIQLVARLLDASGKPVPSQTATWQVTQGSGTLSPISSISDANGNVSTALTLGQTNGPVSVKVTVGSLTAVFNATVGSTGTVSILSGNNQNVALSQAFAQPLVVVVRDANGQPVTGATVAFAVQSGTATLSAPSATTDAQGQARVNVTAGPTAGNIIVTASSGSSTATFALTASTGPSVTAAGFTNGATGQSGISPCSVAVVTGTGLLPEVLGTIVADKYGIGPLPTTFALGSSGSLNLTVNGAAAPIFWVSNEGGEERVAFQVPCETAAGNATVAITVNSLATTVQNVPVSTYAPGVFTSGGPAGKPHAVLYRATDNSYITDTNQVHKGDVLTLFATGLGQTKTTLATNAPGQGTEEVAAPVSVGVNGTPVRVAKTTMLAGSVGVYAVSFEVPVDATSGADLPLDLIVTDGSGNNIKAPTTYLTIQ